VASGWAGAVVVEAGGGDVDGFDDRGGGEAGLVHGGGGGDDGNDFDGVAGLGGGGGSEVKREDLVDGDFLRFEDAVEAFEGEGTLLVEEVGDVRLLKSCLLGETSAGERTTFDAAEEFEAKEFVQVLEVHRVKGFSKRTISFGKTKIKRKLNFEKHSFVQKLQLIGDLRVNVA
jgi:hypothetical protein